MSTPSMSKVANTKSLKHLKQKERRLVRDKNIRPECTTMDLIQVAIVCLENVNQHINDKSSGLLPINT